ncbi:hypothetical protein [Deinococcus sp. Leaf326]|uniref:hypothetical protein n=1 Tax=Deinococcus sp. Leaf326 TaxID=1736338 RepID=UPI0006F9555F|nr:hypothetical protein [Deinococcus sp. Leaf326]KQR22708.1 hypothetical protein ASF71_05880 [Deinococcus sp. Leaf326]
MRRFRLVRAEDVSGSSGTGHVAQGVVFTDGHVAMRWCVNSCSTALYDCIEHVERIHGHAGRTCVEYLDELPEWPEPPFLVFP